MLVNLQVFAQFVINVFIEIEKGNRGLFAVLRIVTSYNDVMRATDESVRFIPWKLGFPSAF